ncbi:MAG: arabinofuranosidase catalytic domain-containing protein [Bacteroidia bacterium]|nr:arabinofuranosidase catalytic domain-containing protein [Bacteroidia bacterium]
MKNSKLFIASLALIAALPCAIVATVATAQRDVLPRPEGPCDVYAAAGDPCAAAHSTTRALSANYNGPLYQIMRQSDGKTLDIGVVQPTATDAGGYADAAAQDAFCKDTYCWITVIYDQSGNENHLRQAPRGGFSGPAMGGFNNISLADWAPVTLSGHKVYGVFIAPGMGYRWNDAKGTAVDDQAEGQYWVINGHHFNSGCCFDYGNAETDSRDDGDGTMETTYYGNQPVWFHGEAPGPWIMTDQENNLIGCVNPDPNDKFCEGLNSVSWRFVTAMADGEPHHWRSMGGDAQQGDLLTYYDGIRLQNPRSSYDPMRKQGAILLGNGGDNSNGSSGTFYEGAMTKAGTFPTIETNQAIQANVVAARYDIARLQVTAADKTYSPNNLQTFALSSSESTSVTFYNNTDEPIDDLTISLELPKKWKANVLGSKDKVRKIGYTVAPGQTVVVTFSVTSSKKAFNGDLVAKANWSTADGQKLSERAVEKVRNVSPVKINEFRISEGANKTNSFIELFNAGDKTVDLSDWTVTQHAINIPAFSQIRIPKGTKLAGNSFYLLGLANSGLAAPANKGDKVIYVRDVTGISAGDAIEVGTGSNKETVKVAGIVKPAPQPVSTDPWAMRNRVTPGTPTTLWQPLPEGPVITIPAGSNNIPVTSTAGMEVGGKLAIGYGATYPAVSNTIEKYEVVTITEVGKPGTQAYLAVAAKPGDTNLKLSSTANISVGDKIRLDIESEGHGVEWVTVKAVGTQSVRNTLNGDLRPDEDPGTGVDLEEPVKYYHSSNMPYSVNGSGVTFEPATKFDHSSNEPVLALVYAIELESALAKNHDVDDVVYDAKVIDAGYQGCAAADQLYGGPAFSTSQGNITLRDGKSNIVDALNYGGVVDPWLGEGFQGQSGLEEPGNFVQTPVQAAQRGAAQTTAPNLSAGRYPDGLDTDENENDFKVQSAFALAAPINAGDVNIKLNSTNNIRIGQRLFIGTDHEEVIAANIGTPGYAPLAENVAAGAKQIAVSGVQSFTVGQAVLVGDETAQIAEIQAARRNYWAPVQTPQKDIVILQAPLKKAHAVGEALAGTGVTVSSPIKGAYAAGEPVTGNVPTPGAPNRY